MSFSFCSDDEITLVHDEMLLIGRQRNWLTLKGVLMDSWRFCVIAKGSSVITQDFYWLWKDSNWVWTDDDRLWSWTGFVWLIRAFLEYALAFMDSDEHVRFDYAMILINYEGIHRSCNDLTYYYMVTIHHERICIKGLQCSWEAFLWWLIYNDLDIVWVLVDHEINLIHYEGALVDAGRILADYEWVPIEFLENADYLWSGSGSLSLAALLMKSERVLVYFDRVSMHYDSWWHLSHWSWTEFDWLWKGSYGF